MRRMPAAISLPFGEYLLEDHARNRLEYDFLNASRHVPFSDPMRKFFWLAKPDPSEDVAAYANRIVAFIRDQFVYEPGMTKVHSTADEILSVGGGVCQDFAHLTIGVLRLAGIPTRYVSGYLAPAANSAASSIGAQASHAWLEAQLPGLGWTGFDPTNGCMVDERHIRVAVGRDYSDVPPMRGVYRSHGGMQLMSVDLKIEPLPDLARPTIPTTARTNKTSSNYSSNLSSGRTRPRRGEGAGIQLDASALTRARHKCRRTTSPGEVILATNFLQGRSPDLYWVQGSPLPKEV